jgi:hypothetical protein
MCADVVEREGVDARGRALAPKVEIERRKETDELTAEEKILVLRVCAAIRRSENIRIREGSSWVHPNSSPMRSP